MTEANLKKAIDNIKLIILKLKYHVDFYDEIISLSEEELNLIQGYRDIQLLYEDFYQLIIVDIHKIYPRARRSGNDKYCMRKIYDYIIDNYDELYALATHPLPKKSKQEFVFLLNEITQFINSDEIDTIIKYRNNISAHINVEFRNLRLNPININTIKNITEKTIKFIDEVTLFIDGSSTHYMGENNRNIISNRIKIHKIWLLLRESNINQTNVDTEKLLKILRN